MTGLIDQDIGLSGWGVSMGGRHRLLKTYSFEIAVYHSLTVYIHQAPRNISQLPKSCVCQGRLRVLGVSTANLRVRTGSHTDGPSQTH